MSDRDSASHARPELTGDYRIDPGRSRLRFVVRHAVLTRVRGTFEEFQGAAHVDAADPARSSVSLAIAASSLDSGSRGRDRYLVSRSFFGAEDDPELRFDSTEVSRAGTTWTVVGDLTIKGVSRQVAIDFDEVGVAVEPDSGVRLDFAGAVTIDRSDWGLHFPTALETGGLLVAESVRLELQVSAVREA